MSDLWPVYVPSKGRAETSKLLRRLHDEEIHAVISVEPHEVSAYCGAFPKHTVLVLPESNKGLTYSRNAVLKDARGQYIEWFWMIDDDVSNFLRFEGTKGYPVTAREALTAAQQVAGPGRGQVALEYQQFAWSAQARVKRNSYCDVVVGINTRVPAVYREVQLKEDRDFTLQVIASGYDTLRVSEYAFAAPSVGSNKGGLHDLYQAKRDAAGAEHLRQLWPWCTEVVVKPSGRTDAKIHWKRVRMKHALGRPDLP